MWIFTKQGFISIKQHKDNPDQLLVRARVKGDLEKLFPGCTVVEGGGTDYRFRTTLGREYVADIINNRILDIDYPNGFKSSVDDHQRRAPHYFRIWEEMADMQDRFEAMEKGGKK